MRTPILILLGVVLIGCSREGNRQASDTTAMNPMSDSMPADSAALDDPTIVAIFDMANTFDIETSQLALEKSQNADVRALAQQFGNDHTAVRQQGRDLAARLGVVPPTLEPGPLSEGHQAAMADLRGKSGAAFDRAYVDHEVSYHEEVIGAIQNSLLPAITNAELKALVEKVAPAFQAHLTAARSLQSKLGN